MAALALSSQRRVSRRSGISGVAAYRWRSRNPAISRTEPDAASSGRPVWTMAKTPSERPAVIRSGARYVEAAAQAGRVGKGQQAAAGQPDEQADRHVDQEDGGPAGGVGQHATEHEADRGAAGLGEAVDAEGARLLVGRGVEPHDQAEDHRRGECAAGALHEAARDEFGRGAGEAAEQAGRGEEGQAGQEDPAGADQVAETAGEQQQTGEGDQVRVHHPGHAGRREAELTLDVGHRDGDDRAVQDDHQRHRAEHGESRGAAVHGTEGLMARP